MKTIQRVLAFLACSLIAATPFTSCEWDTSTEPEHPLYVTYTISASAIEFVGSEQLLLDIKTWIRENQIAYDKQVNYSTGEASEFTKTDADAVKRYEEFVPKFKTFIDEVRNKVAKGAYDPDNQVNATFDVYAKRTQGKDGNLRYEQIKLVYPPADAQ